MATVYLSDSPKLASNREQRERERGREGRREREREFGALALPDCPETWTADSSSSRIDLVYRPLLCRQSY